MPSDGPRMLHQGGTTRIFLGRHYAGILEQRHVDVGLGVARGARIAVPVPDPAEVAALFDDHDIVDPALLEICGCQEAAIATTVDQHFHIVAARSPVTIFGGMRVVEIVGIGSAHRDILAIAIGTVAPLAFQPIALAQGIGIESGLNCVGHVANSPGARRHGRATFCCLMFHPEIEGLSAIASSSLSMRERRASIAAGPASEGERSAGMTNCCA